MKQEYIDTVRLLIDIAPTIFTSPRFAMRGGTALNLFAQDMPRLSVDIDVVFTDHTLSREEALDAIEADLKEAAATLEARGLSVIVPKKPSGEDVKLFVRNDAAEVKVEVYHVFRGTLLPVKDPPLAPAAQDMFTSGLSVPMLDQAELYGSKLVAAMDRQHPRGIFDVLKMYEKFGLDSTFVDCFVAYLWITSGWKLTTLLQRSQRPLGRGEAVWTDWSAVVDDFAGLTTYCLVRHTARNSSICNRPELPSQESRHQVHLGCDSDQGKFLTPSLRRL